MTRALPAKAAIAVPVLSDTAVRPSAVSDVIIC
jgi:hypothetical protein